MNEMIKRLETIGVDCTGIIKSMEDGREEEAREYALYLIAVFDDRHEYLA